MESYNLSSESDIQREYRLWREVNEELSWEDGGEDILFDTDEACKQCVDNGNCSDVECPFYHHQLSEENNEHI